ncbi:MAG: rhomboid family intramembrane serine protease [Bacteroidetes bacterium]|nr:rhomboid family intramembrane serine protease [Bacteroidota bacterium]MBK9049260.1 rhomboid family intramembrane serine protease [Bacteroidota bacterium]MBK9423513.1 rhomboid family intramembrane serine protease [Bacteroidota bacterium]
MSYQEYRPSSFNFLPLVVKNLLIINAIFWLADTVFDEQLGLSFTYHMGLYFPLSELFRPYQFITHLFLHGNFMHLLSNMFALWMFGTVLENFWGPKRFIIFYLITGLGAAFIQTLFSWYELSQLGNLINQYQAAPNFMDFIALMQKHSMYFTSDNLNIINEFISKWEVMQTDPGLIAQSGELANQLLVYKMNIPTIGASGAVFGILLAFGMLFPNTMLYVFFAIPIKAKYFVILYGLFELYAGISNNPGDNVAHFAHLGGMLFGFILIKIWNKKNRQHFY